MIHIESLPDTPLSSPPRLRRQLPFGCIELLFFLSLSPLFGGLFHFWLRRRGLSDEITLPVGFAAGAVAVVCGITAGKACLRALDRKLTREIEQRLLAALNRARDSARQYGYVRPSEGGSQRHRVTISHIDAIWPVEDVALDDLGPGQIVRTAEHEYIYCAGEAFAEAEHDDVEDGVFYLKETITLELSGDLDCVDCVAMSGRRVPIAGDEVAARMLPEELFSVGFAILDDPELIRRLPPLNGAVRDTST